MRIAHVVYECEPGRFLGGVQKMVFELAQAQAARGDLVEILTVGEPPSLQMAKNLQIRYFPGKFHWGSPVIREVLFREHGRFDVIHAHNTFLPLNRFVAATARRFSKRVFFNSHGALDPLLLSGWNAKALKKRIYNACFERPNFNTAHGAIGLTGEECRQLKQFGVTVPIFEVANGIAVQPAASVEEIRAFRDRLQLSFDDPLIVFVGRITAKKGIHLLVEAMSQVKRVVPRARLVICGGREQELKYATGLDHLIQGLALTENVRWAGFLDEAGKRAAFGAATVFAHPSLSEGMALAILEAMCCGVATVVTPGCYMDRAVKAGALLECEQTPVAIAEAIVRFLRDESLRTATGGRARAYVQANHSWSHLADRMAGIYHGEPHADAIYRG